MDILHLIVVLHLLHQDMPGGLCQRVVYLFSYTDGLLLSPFKMKINVAVGSRYRCCHLTNDGASLGRQGLALQ